MIDSTWPRPKQRRKIVSRPLTIRTAPTRRALIQKKLDPRLLRELLLVLAIGLGLSSCVSPPVRPAGADSANTETGAGTGERSDSATTTQASSKSDGSDEASEARPTGDDPSSLPSEEEVVDPEEAERAKKAEERRRRRTILLKTVYDDDAVGTEQSTIVESELGLYSDEDLERYVNSVAIRLLRYTTSRPFEYVFKIVDQVAPNAFALPGGKIYLSRGLLSLVGSEDELAAVIGHEITHAAERHAAARIEHARRLNPLSMGFMRAAAIAAYGREHERDADRGGQILCAKAGYDPIGIATFLRKLDASERYEVGWSRLPFFLATHPTSPERSALASQRAAELEWKPAAPVAAQHSKTYPEMIDGLVLGDDPAGGLFHEGRFVHPDMRFSLRFPPGWETSNSPQAVSAAPIARDAEASLSAVGAAGDLEKTVDELLSGERDDARIRVLERRRQKFGDLPGIRVVARASGLHLELAFIEYGDLIFQLAMKSSPGAAPRYRGRANAFIQSFRPLDSKGIYSLEVTRLRVARARAGETLAQLSARTRNALELSFTGVLNDVFPSTPLERGQPIKIGLAEPYIPKPEEPAEKDEKEGGAKR